MNDLIINGSLYIKRRPTIKKSYILLNNSFNIKDNIGKTIAIESAKDLESLPIQIIEALKERGLLIVEETKIQDNSGFYQIFVDSTSIKMINKDAIYEYQTLRELTQDFISLEDFLATAVYDGRELKTRNGSMELLYELEGTWLIASACEDFFTVIDKNHGTLEGYKLGAILPIFHTKEELYRTIVQNYIHKSTGNTRS